MASSHTLVIFEIWTSSCIHCINFASFIDAAAFFIFAFFCIVAFRSHPKRWSGLLEAKNERRHYRNGFLASSVCCSSLIDRRSFVLVNVRVEDSKRLTEVPIDLQCEFRTLIGQWHIEETLVPIYRSLKSSARYLICLQSLDHHYKLVHNELGLLSVLWCHRTL